MLEGVDKYNNLFGSVVYPEGEKLINLGEAIMQVCVCVELTEGLTVGFGSGKYLVSNHRGVGQASAPALLPDSGVNLGMLLPRPVTAPGCA